MSELQFFIGGMLEIVVVGGFLILVPFYFEVNKLRKNPHGMDRIGT